MAGVAVDGGNRVTSIQGGTAPASWSSRTRAARTRAEQVAVVGRGGGMGDQGSQLLAREGEQPVPRPPVPGELGARRRLQLLRLGRGAGSVEAVVVMGASPPRAPLRELAP